MKHLQSVFLAIVILMLLALPALAAPWELRSGEAVIEKQQMVKGDLIFNGDSLEIDGAVQGDLVVFAREVTVRGRVEGSILGLVTESLAVEGEVTGNIRVLGGNLAIGGKVGRTVSAYALRLLTGRSSVITSGVLGSYAEVKLTGVVEGPVDVKVYSQNRIGGRIASNLTSRGVPIEWLTPTQIGGRVDDYATVASRPPANTKVTIAKGYRHRPEKAETPAAYKYLLLFSLVWFLGTLLMTFIFYRIFPVTAWRIAQPSPENMQRSFLAGLITLMAIPVASIILILTTVGLPIAVLLILIYLLLLLFSTVPFSIFMGRVVFRQSGDSVSPHPNMLVIVGSLVASLISAIPVLGFIIPVCLGMGMIVRNIKPEFREVQHEIRD